MADDLVKINLSAPVRCLWPEDRREHGKAAARAISRLFRAGVETIGDLAVMTPRDVADIRGAGGGTVAEVRRALAACGLSLKDDDPNAAAREYARVRALRSAGIGPVAAQRFARESWPKGEIAPGITLEVAE